MPSRQDNDRSNEARHFKSFRRLAAELVPDGPVTHAGAFGDPVPDGAPDFIIRAADRVLGIEHREVLKPHGDGTPERATEGYAAEVMAMGQELCDLRGTPAARVSVLLGNSLPAKRSDRLAMARLLADLVHRHTTAEDCNVRLDWRHFPKHGLEGVEAVYINRIARIERASRWVEPRAGWVYSECAQLFQDAINDKAPKSAAYRKHCDECWLLLVADSFKPSASIHPNEHSLAHVYSSPFDRTLFLDFARGTVHTLNTQGSRSG